MVLEENERNVQESVGDVPEVGAAVDCESAFMHACAPFGEGALDQVAAGGKSGRQEQDCIEETVTYTVQIKMYRTTSAW